MKKLQFSGKISDKKWTEFVSKVEELASKFKLTVESEDLSTKILVLLKWPESRVCFEISEQFLIEKSDWAELFELIKDEEVYFGEIAGKHSEVYGDLDAVNDFYTSDNLKEKTEFFNKHGFYKSLNQHSFLDKILESFAEKNDDRYMVVKALVQKFNPEE